MKRADIDRFEKLTGQLDGLHQELSLLSKKSPNDAVNQFKLHLINSILGLCNELLGEGYRPFPDFEHFATDNMPSNSDVTFILSQYIECTEKLRTDNITREGAFWYWIVDGRKEKLLTPPPKKLEK